MFDGIPKTQIAKPIKTTAMNPVLLPQFFFKKVNYFLI